MDAIEMPASWSGVRPSISANAELTRMITPSGPDIEMPIGACSNATWKRAWLSASSASTARRSVRSRRLTTIPPIGGLVGEVGAHDLHRDVVAVGVQHPDLERRRSSLVARNSREHLDRAGAVVGVDQVEAVAADEVVERVAEQAGGGRVRPADLDAVVDHEDHVGLLVDEDPEALLALGERAGRRR